MIAIQPREPGLASAVRAGAAGLYSLEAACDLVISAGWLHRDDFNCFVSTVPSITDGVTELAHIDWQAAISSRDAGLLPCSSGENRILRLAASIAAGIPVLGVEPAANVAKVAIEKGVPTLGRFFGSEMARQLASDGKKADLLIGNNVLAHVPDLNDFVKGLKIALQQQGWRWLETYIWSKPNAVPGRFGPRTKDAFEYVYAFAKGSRPHFDLDAIRVPYRTTQDEIERRKLDRLGRRNTDGGVGRARTKTYLPAGAVPG